jgi:hypothetical protein
MVWSDYSSIEFISITTLFFSLTGLTVSGVPLIGQFIRHRLASRLASASIAFWKGKWGKRVREGRWLRPQARRPPHARHAGAHEIALGRADRPPVQRTVQDRKGELAALPETVRRLEGDATRLRESIKRTRRPTRCLRARWWTYCTTNHARHSPTDLAAARALSAERLAATVSRTREHPPRPARVSRWAAHRSNR